MILCWYKLSISYHLRDIPHLKFGKWRWPFRVTEGQIFHLFWEANMGFHNGLLLIRTLSRVPFARYSASKISVSDLDLSGSPKFKYFIFSGKPIWDFIMTFCWYELSIAYCLRDIPHLRFRLVTLTFQGHRRSNISTFWEADMQLYNGLLLIRTLYLVPFARYSPSYFWSPCRKSDIWPSQGHWPQLILRFNRPPVSPCPCASNEIYCVDVCFTVWSLHSFIQQIVLKYWIVPEITWGNFEIFFNFEVPYLRNPLTEWTCKCPLELYSLLYMSANNQLNCSVSSISYVMDNAHLCLGRTKTKP